MGQPRNQQSSADKHPGVVDEPARPHQSWLAGASKLLIVVTVSYVYVIYAYFSITCIGFYIRDSPLQEAAGGIIYILIYGPLFAVLLSPVVVVIFLVVLMVWEATKYRRFRRARPPGVVRLTSLGMCKYWVGFAAVINSIASWHGAIRYLRPYSEYADRENILPLILPVGLDIAIGLPLVLLSITAVIVALSRISTRRGLRRAWLPMVLLPFAIAVAACALVVGL